MHASGPLAEHIGAIEDTLLGIQAAQGGASPSPSSPPAAGKLEADAGGDASARTTALGADEEETASATHATTEVEKPRATTSSSSLGPLPDEVLLSSIYRAFLSPHERASLAGAARAVWALTARERVAQTAASLVLARVRAELAALHGYDAAALRSLHTWRRPVGCRGVARGDHRLADAARGGREAEVAYCSRALGAGYSSCVPDTHSRLLATPPRLPQVALLLTLGADVDARGWRENTALHRIAGGSAASDTLNRAGMIADCCRSW